LDLVLDLAWAFDQVVVLCQVLALDQATVVALVYLVLLAVLMDQAVMDWMAYQAKSEGWQG
jgi:hypothetical protein